MFYKDLAISKEKEEIFGNFLSKLNWPIEYAPLEVFYEYDIITTATTMNNKIIRFEIKYNKNYTNDVVVIEECQLINPINGEYEIKECGLTATKSDYYIIFFQGEKNPWKIKTEKLKELIKNSKRNKHISLFFDKNKYRCYTINKPYFKTIAKQITIN
jgi:hypothetical protein